VQALQDHLGLVGANEEDGDDEDDDDEDKQIWHVDFWDEGLMKVHLEQVQAIDLEGEVGVFLGLQSERDDSRAVEIVIRNIFPF